MLPTTESGATSSGSDGFAVTSAGGDEWLPDGTTETSSRSSGDGADLEIGTPRLTFTTAAGHQVVLTYHDMLLLALFAGAAAAAWRGMNA